MLVENGPLALNLMNVLILLFVFIRDIDVVAFIGCYDLLWFALIRLCARDLALERSALGTGERGSNIWKNR